MKRILVGIKRVVDYNVRIRVKPDGSGVVTDGVKMSINPFDEIALEEALRIKERGGAEEVVVATIGPADCPAAAAHRARHGRRPRAARAGRRRRRAAGRRARAAEARREGAALLVILGKQAIDDDNSQTGQMLAALWNRPQATFASKVELAEGKARVTREVDAGLETLEVDLPAVITTDLRLNEPRYVKLPDIMKAKKKPLETLTLAALGVERGSSLKLVQLRAAAAAQKGVHGEGRRRAGRRAEEEGLAVMSTRILDRRRARRHAQLNPSTAKCVTCARAHRRTREITDRRCARPTPPRSPPQAAQLDGVTRVLTVEQPGQRAPAGRGARAADRRARRGLHATCSGPRPPSART